MIPQLTRNLSCPKVAHQMSRPRHLPKLPIHPGDVNELALRLFNASLVPIPADHDSSLLLLLLPQHW